MFALLEMEMSTHAETNQSQPFLPRYLSHHDPCHHFTSNDCKACGDRNRTGNDHDVSPSLCCISLLEVKAEVGSSHDHRFYKLASKIACCSSPG